MRKILIVVALSSFASFVEAQELNLAAYPQATHRIALADCNAPIEHVASVTNIATGKGVRIFGLDANRDKVLPCGGEYPKTPDNIGAYEIQIPLPQLVKIITDNPSGSCSGALIHPRMVLTAAHCVFSGQFAKRIHVYPGFDDGKSNNEVGVLEGIEVLTFRAYTSFGNVAHDIAAIRLGHAGVHPKFNEYGLGVLTRCDKQPSLYFKPHYNPAVGNLNQQVLAEGTLRGCKDGMFIAGLPSGSGSSGAAVVDRYTRSIIAVHSQGVDGKWGLEAPLTPAKICAIYHFLDPAEQPNCSAGN